MLLGLYNRLNPCLSKKVNEIYAITVGVIPTFIDNDALIVALLKKSRSL